MFTVLFVAVAAQAEDWGTLTGRFVYDGKAPAPQPLSITKDQEVCSKPPTLVDESLEVGEKRRPGERRRLGCAPRM